jgi:SAM-dependent methyltransferase
VAGSHIPKRAEGRAQAIKRAAQEQWSLDPAGSSDAGGTELGTPESFALIERNRYQQQPWMHEACRFERFTGKAVLEIGVGLGTDHLQRARAGARLTGIDLTPRCVELTKRRFEQEGFHSALSVMDAERMEFDNASFDAVYSFGVLHHTASAERAFEEVRRVLRPGGVFIGGLYNRYSLFVTIKLVERLIHGEWTQESFDDRLSRVEYSASDRESKPYVRLFSRSQLRRALTGAGFARVGIIKRHSGVQLTRVQIPAWIYSVAGRTAGWYLIHEAS